METGQPSGHETAIAALLRPAAGAAADSLAKHSPQPQGTLSHPLGTVQTMETGQSSGHETAIAELLPPAAGAASDSLAADSLAAGRPDACGPAADGGGGVVAGVVFVGVSDVSGRVAVLVDALVGELGGVPAAGAGRDLLRSQVAALGRLRAAADAAEARVVAAVDGLGDGGVDAVEVLRRGTGSSQREAQRRKRRAGALAAMPNVAGALAAGDISTEHAEALARAAEATSAGAVDGDAGLLAEVAAVPADRAGRRIQEWTQRHQGPDGLHEQHLRQRRRRRLNFGDGDDGMLTANAAFDRVQGAQFRSLINGIADRIWRSEGGRDNPHNTSAAQRRLDALAIAVGLQPPPPATTATEHRPRNQPAAPTATAAPKTAAAGAGHANPAPRDPDGPEPEPSATAGTAARAGHANPPPRDPDGPEPEPAATAGTAARAGHANPPPRDPDGPEPPSAATAGTAARAGHASPPPRDPDGPEPEPSATAGTAARAGHANPPPRDPDGPEPESPATAGTAARTGHANPPPRDPDGPEPEPPATAGTAARTGHANPAPRDPDGPEPPSAATAPKTERGPRNEPAPPPDGQPSPPRTQPPPDPQPSPPLLEPPPDGQPSVSPRHQVVIVASADVVSGRDPHGRCEIPGVGPIPQSELERLACDAELFGLLFSGKGEPLWHGRAKRSVTDAQRRALIARDGGCVLCAEEPARCEGHHMTPWAEPGSGPTDIDNLALLCGTCHRRLHNHKRVLTRNPDGTWTTTPDPRHHHAGRAPPAADPAPA